MISLAKVTKPWGLSGAVSVFIYGDTPDFFCSYRHFFIENERVEVLSSKLVSRRVVIFLSCSQSVEDAEELRGALLCLPRDEVLAYHKNFRQGKEQKQDISPDVGENTDIFLVNDFIGLQIYGSADQKKEIFLGTVDAFYEAGVGGVFEIVSDKGSFLVPAQLSYFQNVDLKNKKAILVDFSDLLLPEELIV